MIWKQQFAKLRALVAGRKPVDDLDEEIRSHLAMEEQENLESGMTPEEAHYAALRRFGNVTLAEERSKEMWGWNSVETLWQDLRFGLRTLAKNPGFTALAVLVMALGIGANTAVFSVVNTVLLKPLSYRDPDRIVALSGVQMKGDTPTALSKQVSIPDFQDWHDQSSSFKAMAYYASREVPVMLGSTAEYAQTARVSPAFFRVFVVEPVVGRFFTDEEVKQGSGGALMISYAYWQSHFGGNRRALGQSVRIFDRALPIVGVLPPGFRFPGKTDLWCPAIFRFETTDNRGAHNYLAVGRLKPGISLERAQTEMTTIARRLEKQYPESNKNRSVAVTRMRDEMVGDVRLTLYLLLGAVSVVLLIACANTATLLLGRATARTREVAVRVALGASRRRIVRQLITESFILALLAGTSGLLLAYGGSKALVALAPASLLPRLTEVAIDRWVLAFTVGITLATSLLFALVPAIYASKIDLNDALKQAATRSVIGGGMVSMRKVLVVAETALAVVLLSGAGLLIKSFLALDNVDLGFRPENVLLMKSTVPAPIPEARKFFSDVLPQISALPGVLAVGATMAPPGDVDSTGPYFFNTLPPQRDWPAAPSAVLSIVAPGTFAALGIPIKSGRDFDDSDTIERPLVAIVNEALVRKSFAGENPIGRTIYCLFDSDKPMTVVGVAGDVRQAGPAREPMPECYMTYRQHAFNGATLSVVTRTAEDPTALQETLRHLAHEQSPTVPMKFTTMEAKLSENVATPRFRTLLFGLFAGLAVFLAMAGVYGVMAFAVGQRSNEIGVRIALGATTGSVLRLVLGQGLILGGLGLALGLAAAVAGTRLLTTILFQVRPNDPQVYLAVAVLLGVAAMAASYVPARRASKIDPIVALRYE